jgi:hypothetical protein
MNKNNFSFWISVKESWSYFLRYILTYMSVKLDVVEKYTEMNDQSHNNIKRICAWKLS